MMSKLRRFNAAFSLPSSPTSPLGWKKRPRRRRVVENLEMLRDCVQIANKIVYVCGEISTFIEKTLKNNDLHFHYTFVLNIASWHDTC